MKILKAALLTATLGMTTMGCWQHKAVVGSGGNEDGEAAYDSWESHWLFGTIGESEVNVKELCPSGNATVLDGVSFLNGLVGMFIGIVWYPSYVEVYCDGGGAAPAEEGKAEEPKKVGMIRLTPEQTRAVALHPATMQWAKRMHPMKAAELQTAIGLYNFEQRQIAENKGTPGAL